MEDAIGQKVLQRKEKRTSTCSPGPRRAEELSHRVTQAAKKWKEIDIHRYTAIKIPLGLSSAGRALDWQSRVDGSIPTAPLAFLLSTIP